TFLGIAQRHLAKGNSFDEAMHLLIRNILNSPRKQGQVHHGSLYKQENKYEDEVYKMILCSPPYESS
ncbi:MAG: hypothetical protein O7C75_15085, partial [Verrucomicrobia bacterium]|nr:hypothetical protein [Verrucomicrobiota bacterium]